LSSKNNIHVIFNPAARGGKAQRIIAKLKDLLAEELGFSPIFHPTNQPLEATDFARQAVDDGADLIISVGGDGTIQEIINGMYTSEGALVNPDCQLGLLNYGSGQGLAISLGLPNNLREQIRLLKSTKGVAVDVWEIQYVDPSGAPAQRYFINECQIGVGGVVVAATKQRHKWWAGGLAYGLHTLKQIFVGQAYPMDLRMNGQGPVQGVFFGLVLANGSNMGGGMKLVPSADLHDQQLEVLQIHGMNIPQRLWNFSKVYSGKHLDSKFFSLDQVQTIDMDSALRVPIAADGEWLGFLPAQVRRLAEPISVRIS